LGVALAVVLVDFDDALLLVGINSPAYSVWLEITPKVLQGKNQHARVRV
jgi:hypothetical protein